MNIRALSIPLLFAVSGCMGSEVELEKSEDSLSGPFVELWTGTNFTGTRLTVPANLDFNSFFATARGDLNDQISSVRVVNQASITLFVDTNWRGGTVQVNQDIPDLAVFGMSKKASSLVWGSTTLGSGGLRCFDLMPARPCVEMYKDANFGGAWISDGSVDLNDLWAMGWNDSISSVKVFNGGSVTLYDDHGWTGGARTITSNIPDLSAIGFNDHSSAVAFQTIDPTVF